MSYRNKLLSFRLYFSNLYLPQLDRRTGGADTLSHNFVKAIGRRTHITYTQYLYTQNRLPYLFLYELRNKVKRKRTFAHALDVLRS